MTVSQQLITVLIVALVTMLTRFLVFWIFPSGSTPPAVVHYLGRILPPAAIGLLVVYALKDTSLLSGSHGLPELISLAVIAGLHVKFRNSLVSIFVGTVLYMVLVQLVF